MTDVERLRAELRYRQSLRRSVESLPFKVRDADQRILCTARLLADSDAAHARLLAVDLDTVAAAMHTEPPTPEARRMVREYTRYSNLWHGYTRQVARALHRLYLTPLSRMRRLARIKARREQGNQ